VDGDVGKDAEKKDVRSNIQVLDIANTNLNLEPHDLCLLFPPYRDEKLERLTKDICQNGVIDDIVLFEGKILDGWHRYQICSEHNIPFRTVNFEELELSGTFTPPQFVVSKNENRRHLSKSQRAAIAVQLANLPPHRPSKEDKSALMRPYSQKMAAAAMGVSRRLLQEAKALHKEAPAIFEQVRRDEITVGAALKQASILIPRRHRVPAITASMWRNAPAIDAEDRTEPEQIVSTAFTPKQSVNVQSSSRGGIYEWTAGKILSTLDEVDNIPATLDHISSYIPDELKPKLTEFRNLVFERYKAVFAALSPRLFITTDGIQATGYKSQWGFVVCEGSQALKKEITVTNLKQYREQLLAEGVLEEEGNSFVFTRDYEFDHPAVAANIILARKSYGAWEWKDANGVRASEIQKQERNADTDRPATE